MQIYTTLTYYFIFFRMAIIKKKTIGEDMEKLEPSFIAGGNVKW